MSSGEKEAQGQSHPGENQGGTEEEETMQVGRRGVDKKPMPAAQRRLALAVGMGELSTDNT